MTRARRIQQASRSRREHEKEELRQRILKEAAEQFLQEGYDRFSMRKLAETIGYSPATLYLYYRDKDDLLFKVVDAGYIIFREQLASVAQQIAEPRERLLKLGEAYINFGLEHPASYQLMFMWRTDYLTSAREDEAQPRLQAFAVLQDAVDDAMKVGVLREQDPVACSNALWAVMHGIVSLSITMPMFDTQTVSNLRATCNEMIQRAFYR